MKKQTKILVTGASGMVGYYVPQIFSEESLTLTSKQELDITSLAKVESVIGKTEPDFVLHLAAATDVDRCEVEPEFAYQVNVAGTHHVAVACQQKNIPLIYVSTSAVFNGEKLEPYTEFDETGPVNIYAKTKLEGEKIVRNLLLRYFIVRAGWMIGGGKKDKKFVAKIVNLCETQDEIFAVDDKIGTISYAKDFLAVVRQLIQTPFYGTYHVANEGVCSRYSIAMEIVKILKSRVKVTPVPSSRFPLPAPRGRSEAIAGQNLALMGFKNPRPWQEALTKYLKEDFL